jgi:DNA-binding NarL/FixJ family response regulator
MTSAIRILVVDDEPAVRKGLRMRLALEPDVEVVGECCDGKAATELARELHPDVVLMDVSMPVMDGVSATLCLRTVAPDAAVVMLSLYDDLATTNRALAAGAAAFVPKRRMDNILLETIRKAAGRGAAGVAPANH